MIIDAKEYVVFLASCSQLQTVRGEFEAFASPSAKRTDNVVIMSIVSSARKFKWLYIFWNVSYVCFSNYNFFFQIVDCVFAFEDLLFWRGFNHLASISELI